MPGRPEWLPSPEPARPPVRPSAGPPVRPIFFDSPGAFRRWLAHNHATAAEVLVGYWKKHTGRPSLTWQESVDEALCYGWIDGIRRSIDLERYTIRFTPRRKGSTWSAINLRRVPELIRAGRMRAAGLAAYEARNPSRTGRYSFEQRETARFTPELEKKFRASSRAWKFWQAQPPGYRRLTTFYVMSARLEPTRLRRLANLISESAAGERIGILRRPRKPASGSRRSGKAPGRDSVRKSR